MLRAFGGKDDVPGAGRGAAAAVPGLTAREREILVLLAAGTPNPRIAEDLVATVSARPTAPRPSPGHASSA